jgi:hypothetical protein
VQCIEILSMDLDFGPIIFTLSCTIYRRIDVLHTRNVLQYYSVLQVAKRIYLQPKNTCLPFPEEFVSINNVKVGYTKLSILYSYVPRENLLLYTLL